MGLYEQFIGGGNPLATLTFTTITPQATVPVTHTKIDGSYIFASGKSSTTTVERCEFRASLIPSAMLCKIEKGLQCLLVVNPNIPPMAMQLWDGGLVEGGEIFRFMLVDANFRG